MRWIFISILFLSHFFIDDLKAQTGVHVITGWHNYQNWKAIVNESSELTGPVIPLTFFGAGLDYWFRLEKFRIEFFPGIDYTKTFTQRNNYQLNPVTDWTWERYSARWDTHFYLLDMQDDCSCPSFSKQGNFIENSFFISLGLGASYFRGNIESSFYEGDGNVSQTVPFIILGTGLDFGLSDFITITPYYKWQYTPSITWDNLNHSILGETNSMALFNETSAKQHVIGIRVGMNWEGLRRW